MANWSTGKIRTRNALIGEDEKGEFVSGDFDAEPFVDLLFEGGVVSALLGHKGFLESLGGQITGQMAVTLTAELMQHMTPEELTVILERLIPPT